MRRIREEQVVRLLARHREWYKLAKYALRMAEIDHLYRQNPAETVRRARADMAAIEARGRLDIVPVMQIGRPFSALRRAMGELTDGKK